MAQCSGISFLRPCPADNADEGSAAPNCIMSSLLLFLLAALLFFTRISAPLLEPEEARYAEIPREMLAENHFLAPILHGQPYYHKPPLLYWLVMASYQIFGVHDWAARLVPGCAGVLMILLIYWWGRRPLGHRAAFVSALMLCLSARFIYLGRMLSMDCVLALCVLAALLAAFRALHDSDKQSRWWCLSALACGLGLLTKGPVALVLVCVPVLLFQLVNARTCRLSVRAWLGYVALALGIAIPWYLSMALWNWQAFVDFFWVHHIMRFLDPIDHPEPFWFYLPDVLFGLLPWSLLLIPLVRSLLLKSRAEISKRAPALSFFLLAFAWCVLFFSLSGCKRPIYILPALPMLAVALGCYAAHAIDWQTLSLGKIIRLPVPDRYRMIAQCATIGTILAGIGLAVVAVHVHMWESSEGLLIAAVLAGVLAVAFYYSSRLSPSASWLCCIAALFGLLWLGVYQLLPDYNRRFALRGYVRPYAEVCTQNNLSVLCYPRGWDSVSFYLRRENVRTYDHAELAEMIAHLRAHPHCLVFIKRGPSLDRFRRILPASLEYVPSDCERRKVAVGFVRPRRDNGDVRLVKK